MSRDTPTRDADDDDLAVTAEAVRRDAQRIVDIEERKLEAPGDPALPALSAEAAALAARVEDGARVEQSIVRRRRRPSSPN